MNSPTALRLYRFRLSGHCHRVELFLGLADIPAQLVEVDLLAGEHKQQAFLDKNPMGQVPLLEDGAIRIADANAILVYLAQRHALQWLPTTPVAAAQVQRFLSLAAGELAFGPALTRRAARFNLPIDVTAAQALAQRLLHYLEGHLTHARFLVNDTVSIADVALYTYVAHAPEGGVDLGPFAALRRWLARIEALPGFIPFLAAA
jgi:glutathione S-transferase